MVNTGVFARCFAASTMLVASVCVSLAQVPPKTPKAPSKILISDHAGDATILSLYGVDTDGAAVTFQVELDDAIEGCLREPPPDQINPQEVAACAKRVMERMAGKQSKRRAMCSKNTVYTEFGNFSLVNTEKTEPVDGQKMMRTDWKDHRNDRIVGNCSACKTPEMLSTFQVLCPSAYKAQFEGFHAY